MGRKEIRENEWERKRVSESEREKKKRERGRSGSESKQRNCWIHLRKKGGKALKKLRKLIGLVGLIWFRSISTIVGYLMPNLAYSYISDIYDLYIQS